VDGRDYSFGLEENLGASIADFGEYSNFSKLSMQNSINLALASKNTFNFVEFDIDK
jgi:hypothetical protein